MNLNQIRHWQMNLHNSDNLEMVTTDHNTDVMKMTKIGNQPCVTFVALTFEPLIRIASFTH